MKSRFYLKFLISAILATAISSCSENNSLEPVNQEPIEPPVFVSEVNFDIEELPYQNLSDYNFFRDNMSNLDPQEDVIPYDLQSPLFTDYAKKKRYVWMPTGVSANYNGDTNILDFPNETVMVKNFYYDNVQPTNATRIIETRVMYKLNGVWNFAEYVWNEAQTEAVLDLNGSFTDVTFIDENNQSRTLNYRIPSQGECFTCHKKNDTPFPIGMKPQNMNKAYVYEDGSMNQLQKLKNQGFLESFPDQIETVVKWDDPSEDLTERVRAYIDINCAHCHAQNSHCDYRPMRFAYEETILDENLGICVPPDENIGSAFTHIIASGNSARSVLFERITSTDAAIRMPLLGRSVNHVEGAELIEEWINQLTTNCN